jgi:hypothetical protein
MGKAKKQIENPCEKCGGSRVKKILTIIDGPCWSCGETMKIAYISTDPLSMIRGHTSLPPSKFTDAEIEISKAKGANLKVQFSKTMEESYVADTCNGCGTFSGNFYLFQDYVSPASFGELPSEKFEIGFDCENCDEITNTKEND